MQRTRGRELLRSLENSLTEKYFEAASRVFCIPRLNAAAALLTRNGEVGGEGE